MATWDETDQGTEECSECGAVYQVTFKNLPLRDKDYFNCDCGNEMRRWNTSGMYIYERIE